MFLLIGALNRAHWRPIVLLRPGSAIAPAYRSAGIRTFEIAGLATFRPAGRNNWFSYLRYLIHRRRLYRAISQIRAIVAAEPVDLIHFNHENLASIASEVAAALCRPWVCHLRASMKPSAFSRRVYRRIARDAAFAICISEETDREYRAMAQDDYVANRTAVVYNAYPPRQQRVSPLASMTGSEGAFRVLSLSHIDYDRGVDRIVEVARLLARRGQRDVVFYVAGSVQQQRFRFWRSQNLLQRLQDIVRAEGLTDTVRFLGYVWQPHEALAAAHALIRLRRQMNPWGRDIIEAMSAGLPIITLGTFHGFVEPGVNGYLSSHFDPEAIADYLTQLKDDAALRARIAAANRVKAARMFDPAESAARVEVVYRKLLG
jgi:glycosyltransferase involved in cell wall biosynthesis